MLLGLNFQVEGSFAIKALLLFFYPDYEDMINAMDADDYDSIQQVLKKTTSDQNAALKRNLKRLEEIRKHTTTYLKDRGISLLKLKEHEDELVCGVTEFTLLQPIGKCPAILVGMFIGIKNFEPVGNDDFLIDVKNRSITSYGRKIASPHLSDFNLPVGFNPQQISNQVVKQLPDDALIALALTLSPAYRLDFITIDYIGQARKLCYEKELLDQNDVDYLTDERRFLLSGAQYEHSSKQ